MLLDIMQPLFYQIAVAKEYVDGGVNLINDATAIADVALASGDHSPESF